jgi:hypothetical protein
MDGGRAEAIAAAAPLLLLPRERERCAGGGARERKGRRMSDAKADVRAQEQERGEPFCGAVSRSGMGTSGTKQCEI